MSYCDWDENEEPLVVGSLFTLYQGAPRRHVGRQIGFLGGLTMPRVGKKHFPYTEKGKKDAAKARKKMGKKGGKRGLMDKIRNARGGGY